MKELSTVRLFYKGLSKVSIDRGFKSLNTSIKYGKDVIGVYYLYDNKKTITDVAFDLRYVVPAGWTQDQLIDAIVKEGVFDAYTFDDGSKMLYADMVLCRIDEPMVSMALFVTSMLLFELNTVLGRDEKIYTKEKMEHYVKLGVEKEISHFKIGMIASIGVIILAAVLAGTVNPYLGLLDLVGACGFIYFLFKFIIAKGFYALLQSKKFPKRPPTVSRITEMKNM